MSAEAGGGRPFRAVYRLQLTPDWGFDAARAVIPYLRDLGVSHLYLSPSLQARAGSTHGYDVVDPTRLSTDLGGEDAFRALAAAAHDAGLGIVLDIVPNHMATDDANRYWTDEALRPRYFDVDLSTGRHRRFFDIDDLAGVREEDPEVFQTMNGKALSLVDEGLVDALRIDHPDGLADPLQYFDRLREGGATVVWIEKILESGESLREGWPVTGTVGYEFLNDVCGVFVDPRADGPFTELWERLSGDPRPFAEVALEAKLEQARTAFVPEIERLLALVPDAGLDAEGLSEGIASFPVYRTYVRAALGEVADEDREVVAEASLGEPVSDMLLLDGGSPAPQEFVTRYQQTTPAIVAKGIEDTAFYRYGRLLSLCDVGGDPGRFGISVDTFHAGNAERAARFPLGLLTTMTHDTKRSADVRARITALTWLADEWVSVVARWMALTDDWRSTDGAPDDLERSFLLQTLAGAWPIEQERVQGYMEKALREAKRNTNWVEQNADWEGAVHDFVARLYDSPEFLESFEPFARRVAALGDRIALGMLVLKLCSPGVADLYQGDELPLRALVDPDNRRPVDWEWQQAMMQRIQGGADPDGETHKLYTAMRLLGLRLRCPQAFGAEGGYTPLDAGEGVVAFTRGEHEVLVVVGVRREVAGTLDGHAALEGAWRGVLDGAEVTLPADGPGIALDELLSEHGVAVLERVR